MATDISAYEQSKLNQIIVPSLQAAEKVNQILKICQEQVKAIQELKFLNKPHDIIADRPFALLFFCSWCPPSRYSLQYIDKFRMLFPNINFTLVSKEPQNALTSFIHRYEPARNINLAQDVSNLQQQLFDAFQIVGIPYMFLFRKGGEIIWHGHPMDVAGIAVMKNSNELPDDI